MLDFVLVQYEDAINAMADQRINTDKKVSTIEDNTGYMVGMEAPDVAEIDTSFNDLMIVEL